MNLPLDGPNNIPMYLFPAIVAEGIRQCDPQDGVTDGIIMDPYGCSFDYNQLLCTPSANPMTCLTAPQIETIEKFYNDILEPGGPSIFPRVALGSDPFFLLGLQLTLGSDYFKYWVLNDTNWNPATFKLDDFKLAQRIQPGQPAANNFDMRPYKEGGGKIIMYHGWADQLIPSGSSVKFYNEVYRTLAPQGVQLDDFLRLFMVPGMQHCAGGDRGPWYIAGANQVVGGATHSVPGFEDAQHDVILAMMRWVENGTAPDQIIGTKFTGDNAAAGVERQRPLCVYPKQAVYKSGNPDQPGSWACELIY
jgi:feruloyl esterase